MQLRRSALLATSLLWRGACFPTPSPTSPPTGGGPTTLHKVLVALLVVLCVVCALSVFACIWAFRQARVQRKRQLMESSHQRSIAGAGIVMAEVRFFYH